MPFLEISTNKGTGGDFAKFLTEAIAKPKKARAMLRRASVSFEKAKNYGLGSTGKFFREALREAFVTNPFGWAPNAEYTTEKFGRVKIKELIAANKPKMGRHTVRRPKKRILGGRLRSAMFSWVQEDKNNVQIGVIPEKITRSKKHTTGWAVAFSSFQSTGALLFKGTRNSMFSYLAALGMPFSRKKQHKRPARPLIEPMQRKHNPQDIYSEAFLRKLLGKKRKK